MNKESLVLLIIAVVFALGTLLYFINPPKTGNKPHTCPADLKLCPDGSYVGRTLPDCSLLECPSLEILELELETEKKTETEIENETKTEIPDNQKEQEY